MIRVVRVSAGPTLRGRHVTLRPVHEGDAGVLRQMLAAPEVAAWWGSVPDGFPLDDEPEATRFAIVVDGLVGGMVQYGEENEPDFRYAWIDIFVDPPLHGRGVGTDAVSTLVEHVIKDLGHHRVTIDPAVDNVAAVRCYEKAGFRRVGLLREYWLDPEEVWRDGLLLDLLAGELR